MPLVIDASAFLCALVSFALSIRKGFVRVLSHTTRRSLGPFVHRSLASVSLSLAECLLSAVLQDLGRDRILVAVAEFLVLASLTAAFMSRGSVDTKLLFLALSVMTLVVVGGSGYALRPLTLLRLVPAGIVAGAAIDVISVPGVSVQVDRGQRVLALLPSLLVSLLYALFGGSGSYKYEPAGLAALVSLVLAVCVGSAALFSEGASSSLFLGDLLFSPDLAVLFSTVRGSGLASLSPSSLLFVLSSFLLFAFLALTLKDSPLVSYWAQLFQAPAQAAEGAEKEQTDQLGDVDVGVDVDVGHDATEESPEPPQPQPQPAPVMARSVPVPEVPAPAPEPQKPTSGPSKID